MASRIVCGEFRLVELSQQYFTILSRVDMCVFMLLFFPSEPLAAVSYVIKSFFVFFFILLFFFFF